MNYWTHEQKSYARIFHEVISLHWLQNVQVSLWLCRDHWNRFPTTQNTSSDTNTLLENLLQVTNLIWTLKLPNLCELLLYTVNGWLCSQFRLNRLLCSPLAKGKASGWNVFPPLTSFGNLNTTKKALGNLAMEIQVTGNQLELKVGPKSLSVAPHILGKRHLIDNHLEDTARCDCAGKN